MNLHKEKPNKLSAINLCAAAVLSMGTTQAVTVFYDDFEDETGTAPVINTSSTGAGDTADIGSSWSAGDSEIVSDNGSDGIHMLETYVSASTAVFTDSILTDGATVSFDFGLEFTAAGSSYGIFSLQNAAGDTLINLRFVRGNNAAQRSISNDSDGSVTEVVEFSNPANNALTYHSLELTLGASDFSLSLDGATAISGLEYFNPTSEPSEIGQLVLGDNNNSGARDWRIDELTVAGTVVPEPSSTVLLGLGGLALLLRRRK